MRIKRSITICIGLSLMLLMMSAGTAVAPAAAPDYVVVLTPTSDTNPVGADHTVTATVMDASGALVAGVSVGFNITSGPHAGLTHVNTTNSSGQAIFTYTGTATGSDTIIVDDLSVPGVAILDIILESPATKTWTEYEIPEFPTIALPVAAILGLTYLFMRRRNEN